MREFKRNDIIKEDGYNAYLFRLIEKLDPKAYGHGRWLVECLHLNGDVAVGHAYNNPHPTTEEYKNNRAYHTLNEARFTMYKAGDPITYEEFIGAV